MAKASARDVEYDVISRDKSSKPVDQVRRAYERLRKQVERTAKAQVQQAEKSQEKVTKAVRKYAAALLSATRAAGKFVAVGASLVSLLGPMTSGLLAAGKAVAAFGKGVAALGPLAAFLPSLAGALALVVGTLKLAGPGLGRALDPIRRQFVDAEGNASRFTKRLQTLISAGVKPLAAQFVKVNMPAIKRGMEGIARAANRVVVGVGKWVNSAEGQRLISVITRSTVKAMDRLAPKIEKAVIALGRLALRAGDKAISGLADLIGRIIDKFTEWANNTSIEDIKKSIDDLRGYFIKLREAFNFVRDVGRWLSENEGKVRKFSSAIAGLGLALGVLTGNPFAVVTAGLSLLILHWDTVKAKLSGAGKWWSNLWNSIKNNHAIQQLVHEVRMHFTALGMTLRGLWERFKVDALPALRELKTVIMRDLIPAVTSFIAAISPIVVWLVAKFGPVVISTFTMVVQIISGALRVIAGIFNVISAVIRGDWTKFWHGIRQILAGNAQIIVAVFRGAWNTLKTVFSAGITAALKVAGTFGARIKGLFKGAGEWLVGIGKSIAEGLARGIRSIDISGAVSALIDKAKSLIPGPLRGALGFAGGGNTWRPAQFAAQFAGGGGNFAMAGGGTSRAGGPTPVSVESTVNVSLDGAPFRAMTARAVTAAEKRRRWRERVGKR